MIFEILVHPLPLPGEEGEEVRKKRHGAELPRMNFGSSAFF
jgi:hypothetical protein